MFLNDAKPKHVLWLADHIGGTIGERCMHSPKQTKKIVRRPLKCCGPLLLFLTYDSLGIVSSSDVRDQDECSNSHRIQRHIVWDYRNSTTLDIYIVGIERNKFYI